MNKTMLFAMLAAVLLLGSFDTPKHPQTQLTGAWHFNDGDKEEVIVVRFDAETNLVQYVEAMKYKSAAGKQVLWINSIWSDEGKPWVRLDVEGKLFNVDVHEYVRDNEL